MHFLFLAIVFGGDEPPLHQLGSTRAAPHTWAPRHQPRAQSPRGTAWASRVAFGPLGPPLAGWGWPSSARPAACRHLPGHSSGRPAAAPGGSHLCSWPVAWTQGRSPVRRPATPWGRPVSPTRGVVGACGLCLSASSSADAGARWPGVVPSVPRRGGGALRAPEAVPAASLGPSHSGHPWLPHSRRKLGTAWDHNGNTAASRPGRSWPAGPRRGCRRSRRACVCVCARLHARVCMCVHVCACVRTRVCMCALCAHVCVMGACVCMCVVCAHVCT